MNGSPSHSADLLVKRGEDRFGQVRNLDICTIQFKVTAQGAPGVLILEACSARRAARLATSTTSRTSGSTPSRANSSSEVGEQRQRLRPGDSLLAPRQVPHVWAYTGGGLGRILIAFTPPGKMEAFFREVTQADAMPPQNPALWLAHGMELLGPPLALE